MTKLILEEGGQRREFHVGDGRLSVGSGADAKLRLSSSDVAELHLQLDVVGNEARVIPSPGVVAPRIAAAPVQGEATLRVGQVLHVGSARLWLEQETSGLGPVGSVSTSSARPRSVTHSRSVVSRSRRHTRSVPTGLVVALVLVGLGIIIAFLANVLRRQGELGAGPVGASIQAAEQELEVGNLRLAELKLQRIPAAREATADERTRIAELQAEIAQRRKDTDLALVKIRGTKYLDVMLKKYEAKRLAGEPEPHEVRLFLKRCLEFRRRWPLHPGMSWVDRQESRFRGFVDLSATPT